MAGHDQPAYIGGDPHLMGRSKYFEIPPKIVISFHLDDFFLTMFVRFLTTVLILGKPKKSKDEMHKELFLRKRKKQVGKAATNLLDFDFNLGTISESDSSGDEMFLVPANKDLAKSMKSKFTYSFETISK